LPEPSDPEAILVKHHIAISDPVRTVLKKRKTVPPFPQRTIIAACADDALSAAEKILTSAGYWVVNEGGAVEGDAAELGRRHASAALEYHGEGSPIALISGGETTVTLPAEGGGRGGRNTTYLLALTLALNGTSGITALAADTDGIDGSEENAGAFSDPGSLRRMVDAGVDPRGALANADAYTAFEASGDLLFTGPTLTNVNDLRIILIDP
jgi:hydroxypyruvate reductase